MKIIFTNDIHAFSHKLPYYVHIGSKPVLISGYLPTDKNVPNISITKNNHIDVNDLLEFMSENISMTLSYIHERNDYDSINMWSGRLAAHISEIARVLQHTNVSQKEISTPMSYFQLSNYIVSIYKALAPNYTSIMKNIKAKPVIETAPGINLHRNSIKIGNIAKEQLGYLFMVLDAIRESMEKEYKIKRKNSNTVSELNKAQTWIYAIDKKNRISDQLKQKAHETIFSLLGKHDIKKITFVNTLKGDMIMDMNDSIQYAIRGIDFEIEELSLT
jgi:hypothetical protein